MIIITNKRINELRIRSGMSQTELAQKLNVTRSSVNAWEMGISVPSVQNLLELSQIFHASVDYLIGTVPNESVCLDNYSEEEKELIYSLLKYFDSKR